MRRLLLIMLSMLLVSAQLLAQNRTVSGRVTDEKGGVVPNASVLVKGSTNGTSTSADGSFTISVPANARTLVVSSVGLGETEVSLTSASNYNVVLSTSAKNLQEVVVVGYGTQRRTNVTGAIATVRSADIENKPFTSVDKALQGNVPGLQSASASGAPGAATDIRIRGTGSITASNQPLWVIDGVIATTGDLSQNTTTANILSTLNPDDIESISVLKDAASASIYGSRAANGVILVTTKKGKAGKTSLNFSTEIGQNDIAYKSKTNRPMTTAENQAVLREALINAGYAANNDEADALITDPTVFAVNPKVNTNWLDQVTRKGMQQQYNLSLNGGNDKTQFYASGGYFSQKGTTIATDFRRVNGALSVTHHATDRITFTAGINGSSTDQNTPANGGAFANPVLASYFLPSWYAPYNADGTLKWNDAEGQFPVNGGVFNPLVQAAWNKNLAKQTALRGNVTGEYRILDDLKFTSRYSAEYLEVQEDQYRNPFYGDGQASNGDAFSSYNRVFDWTWSNFADFRHKINASGDIYFDLKAGYEAQQWKNYLLQAGAQNFPLNLGLTYLASSATPTTSYALPQEYTTNSLFSSGDVNFKNKYVLSGSFRRDGSSVFGANHRWGNFYSVGGSWNANEEEFIKNIEMISLLKVRASYGTSGNANGFGPYSSLAYYTYGTNYLGQPGSSYANVGNSNLTWEKNGNFDAGLDFGLLKNRLTGSFDYYKRKTSDMILFVPFSLTTGFSGQNQNVGAMTNTGIEVALGGKPVMTKDFTWDVNINFAHNTNKVTELYKSFPVPYGSYFNATVGSDVQAFYLRQWAGVDPANGKPLWYTDATRTKTTSSYSAAKQALVGRADPKYFGSFNNTFSYKGISLSAQIYYNFGNNVMDTWGSYLNSDGYYYGGFNQMSTQLNSWKKAGDVTDVPQIIYGGNSNSYRNSTRYLHKGDYVRLRDLQLSYLFPKTITRKLHLANLSLYVRGTNLFTYVKDKNLPFDPEAGANATTNLDVFIPKSITGGIKIGL